MAKNSQKQTNQYINKHTTIMSKGIKIFLISAGFGGAGFGLFKWGQKVGRKQQENVTPLNASEIIPPPQEEATSSPSNPALPPSTNAGIIPRESGGLPEDSEMPVPSVIAPSVMPQSYPTPSRKPCDNCGGHKGKPCQDCKQAEAEDLESLLAILLTEIEEAEDENLGSFISQRAEHIKRNIQQSRGRQSLIHKIRQRSYNPWTKHRSITQDFGANLNEPKNRFFEKILKRLLDLPTMESKIEFLKNQILEIREKKQGRHQRGNVSQRISTNYPRKAQYQPMSLVQSKPDVMPNAVMSASTAFQANLGSIESDILEAL